jgi:colanic acid/amylovoran biosynthesis glycosyltransferase
MKKVLFFIDSFPNYSETFLYNQIYFLLDNGVEVQILAIKEKKYSYEILHQKMIEYDLFQHITVLRHGFNISLILNVFLFPKIAFYSFKKFSVKKALFIINSLDILNRFQSIDVVHAHYGHVGAMVADLRAIGLFKYNKLICSFHGEEILPVYIDSYQSKYTNLIKYFNIVTANSFYVKNLLQKSLNGVQKSLIVFPESLDTTLFKPLKKSKLNIEIFSILFVGRLIEWKAPILAIRIIHRLIQLGYKVRLDIVGSGPEFDNCLMYTIRHKLEQNVFLHGALSQEIILELYQNADTFLFPGIKELKTSKAEAQGLVIQEAQAMELPVIISDVGGMKFGMLDNETGFIVRENDLDGFVEKIIFLIQNPSTKVRMGKMGREFVLKTFDVQVLGKRLLALYGLN